MMSTEKIGLYGSLKIAAITFIMTASKIGSPDTERAQFAESALEFEIINS